MDIIGTEMCSVMVAAEQEFIASVYFKAQRSLYVPHSGHDMYRTAVTIRIAQWSLYVPPF